MHVMMVVEDLHAAMRRSGDLFSFKMFVHVQTLHQCKAPGNHTQQVFCPGFDPQQLFLIFLFFPLVPFNTFILCGLYSTCTVHVETLAS